MNKVILMGFLGQDPKLATQNVCKFKLATSDKKKDADGTWVDATEWHNITVFGKSAENCAKYLSKGSQVLIEGKIKTDQYKDKS